MSTQLSGNDCSAANFDRNHHDKFEIDRTMLNSWRKKMKCKIEFLKELKTQYKNSSKIFLLNILCNGLKAEEKLKLCFVRNFI